MTNAQTLSSRSLVCSSPALSQADTEITVITRGRRKPACKHRGARAPLLAGVFASCGVLYLPSVSRASLSNETGSQRRVQGLGLAVLFRLGGCDVSVFECSGLSLPPCRFTGSGSSLSFVSFFSNLLRPGTSHPGEDTLADFLRREQRW